MGTLIVSPGPVTAHQIASGEMEFVLRLARQPGFVVLDAPYDVVFDDETNVQPDILVCRAADLGPRRLEVPPLLVVEILSPSTRLIDLNLKRARYERAGVASYWVVDPDEPRLVVWELRGGSYTEVADVAPDETWTSEQPFPVSVTPAALVTPEA